MITNTKLDPIETASVDELQALQTQCGVVINSGRS